LDYSVGCAIFEDGAALIAASPPPRVRFYVPGTPVELQMLQSFPIATISKCLIPWVSIHVPPIRIK
jgi:hypothetical protein